jgi:pyruvate ferredoxin oxidoreductase gamma subunit
LGDIQTPARSGRLLTIPATDIAREHLGRPVPNVVMLAGFAALTGLIGLASLSNAILEHFPGKVGERNVAAAQATFERVNSTAVPSNAR